MMLCDFMERARNRRFQSTGLNKERVRTLDFRWISNSLVVQIRFYWLEMQLSCSKQQTLSHQTQENSGTKMLATY